MPRQKKETENAQDSVLDWRSEALELVARYGNEIRLGIMDGLHAKIEQTKIYMLRRLIVLFFLAVGIVFLMAGTANMLNVLSGNSGFMGFFIVGLLAVVVASFLNIFKK